VIGVIAVVVVLTKLVVHTGVKKSRPEDRLSWLANYARRRRLIRRAPMPTRAVANSGNAAGIGIALTEVLMLPA
jgi:hypothetical protein